jgi:AmmeMemoRadiSam system protein B
MAEWYPSTEQELNKLVTYLISNKPKIKLKSSQIHGIIVPHAGYAYSGEIAGEAFSLLKQINPKIKKAIIIGPSHYTPLKGIASLEISSTPLGQVNIIKNQFPKIPYEHSIQNQIPFLQKLNTNIQILPLVIGNINEAQAKEIANMININYKDYFIIISTDLSHFLPYNEARQKDENTLKIISQLDLKQAKNIDACGIYPLLVFMHLAKQNNWHPKLIEYKNSGDITGDKSQVVGYSSWVF